MEILHTDKAPAAIGPYSQAIETGGLIFASGQLGLIPDTGALAPILVSIELLKENLFRVLGQPLLVSFQLKDIDFDTPQKRFDCLLLVPVFRFLFDLFLSVLLHFPFHTTNP